MVTLSNNNFYLFGAVSLVVVLWSLIRNKEWQQVSAATLMPALKLYAIFAIPAVALSLIASCGGLIPMETAAYVGVGALVACVLGQLGLSPFLRSIILLAGGVLLTAKLPSADPVGTQVPAVLSGVLAWKAIENFSKKQDSTFEDVLPLFIWLTGCYWLESAGQAGKDHNREALVLGVLSTGIFLRWIQSFIMYDDRNWFKRMLLAASGGLSTLIIVNKLMLAPELATIASLAGAAFFLIYIFEAMEKNEDGAETIARTAKRLIFIGIFTLLATRLFGMLGLLVLAAAIPVATKPGVAQVAAVFFTSRVLIQAFVYQFNPNVTGVNITHSYTSAAMYAAFFLVIMASLLLRNATERWLVTAAFIAVSILLPIGSNYFLHAEPTSSLLVSTLVTSIMFAIFAPALYSQEVPEHENIILLPAIMASTAALTNGLIPMGNEATSDAKLHVLIGVAVFLAAAWAAKHFITSKPQTAQPAEAP